MPRPRHAPAEQTPEQVLHALREELLAYKTVADFTYDWEIWRDASGALRYVSPSCLRVSGYEAADFIRDPGLIEALIHPEDLPRWREAMLACASQDSQAQVPSMDFRIRARNGELVWIGQETTRVFGPDNIFRGLRLSLRDVTERVMAQTALRQAHEQLETRVQERTEELAAANRQLRQEIRRGRRILKELEQSRAQYRDLSNYLQERVEAERSRISREIHDELGQNLTALNMGLFRLERLQDDPASRASQGLAELRGLVAETLAAVQRISRELRPALLDELGFTHAVAWQARVFQEATGVAARVEIDPSLPEITPQAATALYRVAQEALTNVARHAQASAVELKLWRSRGALRLTVADDGAGFDPRALESPASLGLMGMRERLRALGGDLELVTRTSGGALVAARLPLARNTSKAAS
jgi:PAS domain S-box-containing protein